MAVLVLAGLPLAGCGYSLAGKGNFLPEYIAIVAIPPFTNRTDRVAIEEVFTRKVVEEFTSRGRYRIQADTAGADAVLQGTVVSFTTAPTVLQGSSADSAEASQASTYTVIVRAQVQFKDLVQNKVLWQSNNFQFRDDYEVGENPEEFFDQESLTLQRLAEEFAKSLVSSILEAF
jgi:Lipopolysaccharide-assembly